MSVVPSSTPVAPAAPPVNSPAPPASTPGAKASDQDVRNFITTNYPSYSFALEIPELVDVIRQAMNPDGSIGADSASILSKLQATNWWKTHGDPVRQYMQLQYTDPNTLALNLQAKEADIHQVANKMGLADNQIDIQQMARNAVQFGWSPAELQEQLASHAQFNADAPSVSNIGTIDNAMAQLKKSAGDYMVTIDDHTAFQWARDVAAGHHLVEDYTPIMQGWAKGRFPTLSSFIDQGITPSQYFQPQQQEVAKLLELPGTGVDLVNDPKFSKIINYADPKTGAPRPMTLSETQAYVRSMDPWKKTKQAQQQASDMTEGILQMFGKVASGSSTSGVSAGPNAY